MNEQLFIQSMVRSGLTEAQAGALSQALGSNQARQNYIRRMGGINTPGGRQPTGPTGPPGTTVDFGKNVFANIKNFAGDTAKAASSLENVIGPFKSLTEEMRQYRLENEEFFKAGYSDQMFNFSKSMEAASDRSMKLTGNLKSSVEATRGFRSNFEGLGFVTDSFRKSLMETGTTLAAAGFSMQDYAGIVESAAYAFNMGEGEIDNLSATLVKTSREFAIAPEKLTQNFQLAQKNFAYTSKRFMNNFLELQKMSRTTGVSFDQLASSFGDNLDSFRGSAQMAGQLNQILGQSMFNSIDLLNKTEAERAKTIREGILSKFGKNVDQMQKFELKAVASSLKMSVEETRRFLRGESPKAIKDLEKLEKKDPVKMASANLANEISNLSNGIMRQQRPAERSMIDLTNSIRKGVKASDQFAGGVNAAANRISAALAGMKTTTLKDGTVLTGEGTADRMREAAFNLGKSISDSTDTFSKTIQKMTDGLRTTFEKQLGEGFGRNRKTDLQRIRANRADISATDVKLNGKNIVFSGPVTVQAPAGAAQPPAPPAAAPQKTINQKGGPAPRQ